MNLRAMPGAGHEPSSRLALRGIEHGGGGASAAAPVARDVMRKTFEIMGIAPDAPVMEQPT